MQAMILTRRIASLPAALCRRGLLSKQQHDPVLGNVEKSGNMLKSCNKEIPIRSSHTNNCQLHPSLFYPSGVQSQPFLVQLQSFATHYKPQYKPLSSETLSLSARFLPLCVQSQPFSARSQTSTFQPQRYGSDSQLLAAQLQPFGGHFKLVSSCIHDPNSLKPDPVSGLTPKMVQLLKCLAVAIKPDLHMHGVNIFQRVFEMDRNIQRMFPKFPCDDICALEQNPAFNAHVDVVMKAILNIMEVSGSVPDLKSSLALQRKIHKDLCIPDKHFLTFGNAINDYLREALGVKYTEEVECAVAFWWKFVASEMTAKAGQMKCAQCGAIILKAGDGGKRPK